MTTEIKKAEGVSFEGWTKTRKNFIDTIQRIMVSGKDYHDLNFRGKDVRVLAKGGAEKVASAFGWTASFIKDNETVEMLGLSQGVAYICKLMDKNEKFIGEGRGARTLKQDAGDPNKTIKMAQKSAFIDAVLRTSGLSDLFTQDLDEVQDEPKIQHVERVIETEAPKPIVGVKQEIVKHLKRLGLKDTKNKKEVEEFVLKMTGMDLVEENYQEIKDRLSSYEG